MEPQLQRAPVLVVAFRRAGHLRNTLACLLACHGFDESPVYVSLDGPRGPGDEQEVLATRAVAHELLGERATYREQTENRGLAASVIASVDAVLERHTSVIVVEDDLELSPAFLDFMNEALRKYERDERVWQVSGYQLPLPDGQYAQAFFLPFSVSWGWGTWRRSWNRFDRDAKGWEQLVRDWRLRHQFNLGGTYNFSNMLIQQMLGRKDSWAIRWYWSVFRAAGVVLFPPHSLVRNRGFDGSGTHGKGVVRRFGLLRELSARQIAALPDDVAVSPDRLAVVKRCLIRQNGGLVGWLIDRARTVHGIIRALFARRPSKRS